MSRPQTSRTRPSWAIPGLREIALWIAFAGLYVAAAKLGFRAAFVAEQVSPVWPPAGLALWAIIWFGARGWPAVWVGAAAANMLTNVAWGPAFAIATGNTLEAIIGAELLRRVANVDRVLVDLRQVVTLILCAAILSTAVGATIGVGTLCVTGLQPWTRFGTLWWTWWLGDATGDLLFASVLLTLPLWRHVKETLPTRVALQSAFGEIAAIEVMAIAVGLVVFLGQPAAWTGHHPLEYLLFPLVMWAGLRFAHPGAALVSATVSCIAVVGTLRGAGPFGIAANSSAQESLTLLQIYTAVMAASGLVFGAAIADRNHEERLRETDHRLTAILAQAPDLKSAACQILQLVSEMLGWRLGILWRVENGRLECVDSWQRESGLDEFIADSRTRRFHPGIGLPGRVWATAQPAWIPDVAIDPNFPRSAVATRLGLHAAFAFPIVAGSQVLGVMEFFTRESRPMDASLLALMAAAGSQIGQFIERGRAQQRVLESEALTSAIIAAALDCVITIDADGKIIEFNPAASRTFGFAREEVVGRELAEIIVPPRLRDRHRDALRRCVETGEARILGNRIELPALRSDGTELPVELAITRVIGGERPVFTAHLRDITDRKHIELERAELLERERTARVEAETANSSKDQFLATVSHELRTPLTAILGWASILESGQFAPERLPQIHDSIFRNAQAQAQIINDLLDVSRIVTGQMRLQMQPTDLREAARVSLEMVQPTAVIKGVTLKSALASEACVVSADPTRLQQVIWNLLTNAVKFTPTGGSVELAVRAAGQEMVVEVTDTGIGMPAALLPRVFERFWQADSTSTRIHGGLGLGLALVRNIVEAHGGKVEAASAGEGHGSTFLVRLPACPPDHAGPPVSAPTSAEPRAGAPGLES